MSTAPSGDARFRAIFDAHHRELHAYCLRRLGATEANEAAADALFAVWRHIDEAPPELIRGWLFGLARHAVEYRMRRPGQVRVLAREGAAVPTPVGAGAVQTIRHPSYVAIDAAMAALRPLDREVLLLELWDGLAADEIASALGIGQRSVAHRRRRALARMAGRARGRANDPVAIARRIRVADPVPSADSMPFEAVSSGRLLAMVDARRAPAGPLAPLQLDEPGDGKRGLVLAGLVASAGVLVVLFLALGVVGPPERRTPPTTPPPTTTTTLDPNALPGDTPPLDVVEAMYTRWEAADIDGYRALIDADSAGYNVASMDRAAWYRLLSGVTDERECALVAERVVSCVTTYYSGLGDGRELITEVAEFTVRGGRVTRVDVPEEAGLFSVSFDDAALAEYREWVRQVEPERFDELFAFGTSILLHTPELRALHGDLMAVYRSGTVRRPTIAPIKAVDEFFALWGADSTDGYAARVALLPATARSFLLTEEELQYVQVTGVALGRICDTELGFQVTCDLTYYSGLAPGVELTGHLLRFTIDDGVIVDVEALSPTEDVVIADEPALARYRAWLATADPAADALFTADGHMDLTTEAARAAHRTLIARFLEEGRG